MATSGTSAFTLNIAEIVEEAFEQCGLKAETGYDLQTARRSLNLLLLEWQNRGVNFWTLDQTTRTLSTIGANSETLDADTLDVLDVWIRSGSGTSQVDLPLTRMSSSEYATIPNKNVRGRPVNFWVDRKAAAPVMYLWPTPDVDSYTLAYNELRRLEDSGEEAARLNADIHIRFLPALIAGLALKVAQKKPEAAGRVMALEAEAEKQWGLASAADRDRASLRLTPGGYRR